LDEGQRALRHGLAILLALICLIGLFDMVSRNNLNIVGVIMCLGGIYLATSIYRQANKIDKEHK
jgi:hypothetical protein